MKLRDVHKVEACQAADDALNFARRPATRLWGPGYENGFMKCGVSLVNGLFFFLLAGAKPGSVIVDE